MEGGGMSPTINVPEDVSAAPRIQLFVTDRFPAGPENMVTHFFFGVLSELYRRDALIIREFLLHAGVSDASSWRTDNVQITEQVRDTDKPGRGILDVAIHRLGGFYVIVEAKLGAPVDPGQLQRYATYTQGSKLPWWVLSVTRNASDRLLVTRLGQRCITHTTWQHFYRFVTDLHCRQIWLYCGNTFRS